MLGWLRLCSRSTVRTTSRLHSRFLARGRSCAPSDSSTSRNEPARRHCQDPEGHQEPVPVAAHPLPPGPARGGVPHLGWHQLSPSLGEREPRLLPGQHPWAHLGSKEHVVPQVVHQELLGELDQVVTAVPLRGDALLHDALQHRQQVSLGRAGTSPTASRGKQGDTGAWAAPVPG